MKGLWRSSLSLGLMAFIAGCGSSDSWTKSLPDTIEASGYVTLNTVPVEGASVVFAPVDGKYAATGVTNSSGYFELKAFPSKSGAVPGSYKVGVMQTVQFDDSGKAFDPGEDSEHHDAATASVGWKNALPERYKSPETSGLTASIPEEGTSEIKIELLP